MTRYRIWLHQFGRWQVYDTYQHFADASMAMATLERTSQKAICVVRDSAIDRHLLETGRLPTHALHQLAREGKKILAERTIIGNNPGGMTNGN